LLLQKEYTKCQYPPIHTDAESNTWIFKNKHACRRRGKEEKGREKWGKWEGIVRKKWGESEGKGRKKIGETEGNWKEIGRDKGWKVKKEKKGEKRRKRIKKVQQDKKG
jgi:hypothetical protein